MDYNIILADPITGELTIAKEIVDMIRANEVKKREIAEQDKEFKAQLKAAMEHYGVEKITTPDMTVSYVAEHEQVRLDPKAVQAEDPKLYNKCLKVSDVKASVRVRIK